MLVADFINEQDVLKLIFTCSAALHKLGVITSVFGVLTADINREPVRAVRNISDILFYLKNFPNNKF